MTNFIVNKAGAKIYKDITKHEILTLPILKSDKEQGAIYEVLSVGVLGSQRTPVITVKEASGDSIAYRLPNELSDWVENMIGFKLQGFDALPSKVEFGIIDNIPYAEML